MKRSLKKIAVSWGGAMVESVFSSSLTFWKLTSWSYNNCARGDGEDAMFPGSRVLVDIWQPCTDTRAD